ncbi:M48 family metallopeptidase [Bifidobacterium vespertilionis]|uniref:M48 family metallopeptidase n=1 Tax=Bifidobacterium vespertilionis TaxID=2562524 RepID=UPI001BDCD1E7|nr:SprT family zinc-dependent metalloprotease [Bifidobacterium vespertilionis]MBT1179685.1 M48 family metallopeptidase [Bifidobacterium vespertilionis]
MPYDRRIADNGGVSGNEKTLNIVGIAVHVTRKPIKNMYLRIKPPEGRVEVSAPMRMTDRRIAEFVAARREWVEDQRRRVIEARERTLGMSGVGGVSGAGEGDDGDAGTAGMAGTGDVPLWSDERKQQAADAINAQLPALLARWSPIVGRAPTHVTLRLMSSRWGSCTPRTGRIRLNLQLGLMEPRFLEYVLVHEMTHLWASGHGAEFQRRMTSYLPDWRATRRDLNRRVVV